MPDAVCDKCNKSLGELCTTVEKQQKFNSLVTIFATKDDQGNIVTTYHSSTSPGICHIDLDPENNCDGVFLYEPSLPTPTGIEW